MARRTGGVGGRKKRAGRRVVRVAETVAMKAAEIRAGQELMKLRENLIGRIAKLPKGWITLPEARLFVDTAHISTLRKLRGEEPPRPFDLDEAIKTESIKASFFDRKSGCAADIPSEFWNGETQKSVLLTGKHIVGGSDRDHPFSRLYQVLVIQQASLKNAVARNYHTQQESQEELLRKALLQEVLDGGPRMSQTQYAARYSAKFGVSSHRIRTVLFPDILNAARKRISQQAMDLWTRTGNKKYREGEPIGLD